jgi:hypothetical protein
MGERTGFISEIYLPEVMPVTKMGFARQNTPSISVGPRKIPLIRKGNGDGANCQEANERWSRNMVINDQICTPFCNTKQGLECRVVEEKRNTTTFIFLT